MLNGLEDGSRDLYYAAKELSQRGFEADAIHCYQLSHLARHPDHVIAFELAKEYANLGSYSYAFMAICCALISAPSHEAANRWLYPILLLAKVEQEIASSVIEMSFPSLAVEESDLQSVREVLRKENVRLRFADMKRVLRELAGRDCGFRVSLVRELRFEFRENPLLP